MKYIEMWAPRPRKKREKKVKVEKQETVKQPVKEPEPEVYHPVDEEPKMVESPVVFQPTERDVEEIMENNEGLYDYLRSQRNECEY